MTFGFGISDDQRALRDGFRDLLAGVMSERRTRQVLDGVTFDHDIWREVGAGGWLEVGLAESGALDVDQVPSLLVHLGEQVGARLLPGPFSLVASMVIPLLHGSADEDLPFDYASVASGATVATIVGPSGGSPAHPEWRQFEVSAEGSSLHVSGRAVAVPIGHLADWILAPITRPDGSVGIVLLDGGAPEIHREQDAELDFSRPTGAITIKDLQVDKRLWLGDWHEDHRGSLTASLQRYLLGLDAESIGGADAALRRTIAYVSTRQQFGVPVGSFQAVKHLLADAWSKVEIARGLTHETAWTLDADPSAAAGDVLASRILAAEMYPAVLESCIQCHGGAGFTWEQGLHGWYRQALYYRHHLFSPDALREVLFAALVSGPSRSTAAPEAESAARG
jgi:acyl-CoA dehydrogenase